MDRLLDVESNDGRIHLIFEFIDMSLVSYIGNAQKNGGMPIQQVKVG